MPVSGKLTMQQGHVVRERSYPLRHQQLEANKRAQSANDVKDVGGLRPFANFPDHEIERLAEKGRTDKDFPSYYADLDSHDAQIASRAKIKLVNSVDGKKYRVGETSSKSFRFSNNPLAKG